MSDPPKPTGLQSPTTPEGIRDLLRKAVTGDKTTLPAVRKLLEDPANVERFGGNLARYAQGLFVDALCGADLGVREAIHAKLAAIRRDLLGDNPTPVQRLLVERAAACWLQVQDADIRAAHAQKDTRAGQTRAPAGPPRQQAREATLWYRLPGLRGPFPLTRQRAAGLADS